MLLLNVVTRNSAVGGRRTLGERRARMCLENARTRVTRSPLTMDACCHGRAACCHGRADQQVVAVADVLNLVVVTDLLDVRPVVELATDTDQHYLPMLKVLRM